ncbi:MAG: hypothetical protein IPJ39_01245 [Saprospiraceae bacterium]|nr:hypothetical protein [Saprospiraceae bacterium]
MAVGDLKEINSQWDVYSAFQEILNNDRFRNLIRNSKPTWVEEFLLGQIRRNNWSVVPYKALRFLEKEGIIKFNPELYALNLANQRDHKNNSKESEFIKSFLEDSVALTRDIPLLFEYETNINNNSFHIQNNDKSYTEYKLWHQGLLLFLNENKISRDLVVSGALSTNPKNGIMVQNFF